MIGTIIPYLVAAILAVVAAFQFGPTIGASTDGAKATNAITKEVGAILNAAPLYVMNDSTSGSITGITNGNIRTYVPEFNVGTGVTALQSKVFPGVNGLTYNVTALGSQVVITMTYGTDITAALQNKMEGDLGRLNPSAVAAVGTTGYKANFNM